MPKVFLSPSDQHGNPVSSTPPTTEKSISRARAIIIARILKAHGCEVLIGEDRYATTDEYADRPARANSWGADLVFCDHSDAGGGSYSHTIYFPGSSEGQRLATLIEGELDKVTPWPSRGAQARNDLYELSQTDAVAVLTEVGFHDNSTDAQWISTHLEAIATALAKGILTYLGITYRGAQSTGDVPMDPAQWTFVYTSIAGTERNGVLRNSLLGVRPANGKESAVASINRIVSMDERLARLEAKVDQLLAQKYRK